MGLSIRNQRAEQLAREVAREAGENITQAVLHALEERLLRLKGRRTESDTFQTIMEISKRCSALPDVDRRTPEHIMGYDEQGTFSS